MKQYSQYVLMAMLFCLAVWFLVEFKGSIRLMDIPWGISAIYQIFFIGLVDVILFAVGLFFIRRHLLALLISAVSLVILGSVGLAPFVALLLIGVSTTLIGKAIFKKIGLDSEDRLSYPLYFAVGAGTYAVLVSLMVLYPINYTIVYFAIVLAPICIYWKSLKEISDWTLEVYEAVNSRIIKYWVGSFLVFGMASVYLLMVLMPEFGYDAQTTHLRIPGYVYANHFWHFDVKEQYGAVIPMNGNWLYTVGFMLGGEAAVRLLNIALLGTVVAQILALLVEWKQGRLLSLAAALILSLPIVYLASTSLFIENVLALFSMGALSALLLFASRNQHSYLWISAFLFGVALGAKLQTSLLIVSIMLALFADKRLFHAMKNIPTLWSVMGISILLFLGTGIIPYFIAYIKTGNPVFPFFNGIFKSPYFDTGTSFDNLLWKEATNLLTLKNLTFSAGKYIEGQTGSFGWHFFFFLPLVAAASFFYRIRHAFFLLLSTLLFTVIIFHFQAYLRYIYPVYFIFTWCIILFINEIIERNKKFGTVLQGTAWGLVFLNLLFLPACNYWYRDFSFKALFSPTEREALIHERAPYRKAVEYINVSEKAGINILVAMSPFVWDLRGKVYNANNFSYFFSKEFYGIKTEVEMLKLLKEKSIHYLLVDENYGFVKGYGILPIIQALTKVEKQFGSISVRVLRDDLSFSEELLKNPDFQDMDGWVLSDTSVYNKERRSLLVSETKIATQTVAVKGGEKIKMEVETRCAKQGSTFRMQINWMDRKGGFIGTDLTPLGCTDIFKGYSKVLTVPEKAVTGIVYVNGHSPGDLVEFAKVSLKR